MPYERRELDERGRKTIMPTDSNTSVRPWARIAIAVILATIPLAAEERDAGRVILDIATPRAPPEWALLERELLDVSARACEEFYERYFDERGFLLCVERWGGDDGPDDAIENCRGWPILHALGASDRVLELYKKAWEGHLRQYTLAKTREVPFARDGMYYKEFPVMMDWLHNGEGLSVFNVQGLSDPDDRLFRQRVERFAGFYLGNDPHAPNYDPKHRIIRSLFNGSRGPLLRKATALDWAGDRIEVEGRFHLLHGERNYAEMLAHFKDYNDIVGDHPSNLSATTLSLNAYLLTGDKKYRRWILEYVDAWVERTKRNDGIIPSNIGLDGTIGGATDGKWYGGVYGWGFSVTVPQDGSIAHRTTVGLGVIGFLNAHFLTGDAKYLDVWGEMIDRVNENGKLIDGERHYPHKYGDEGWYAWSKSRWNQGARDIWYASMSPKDRERVATDPWVRFLVGENPEYPVRSLHGALEHVRRSVAGLRADRTTPDTRLADEPMSFNPASTAALVELMLGGVDPGNQGHILRSRLRYFDPERRRAGLPPGVASLVTKLDATRAKVTLVNVDQIESRIVVVQAGAYAEHRLRSITHAGETRRADGSSFEVRLAPGSGAEIDIEIDPFTGHPTMAFPWSTMAFPWSTMAFPWSRPR